jgi:putative SOS response-associated peptidase YedK
VLLEPSAFDQWLAGTVEEARALMQLTPVETFAAGPSRRSPPGRSRRSPPGR